MYEVVMRTDFKNPSDYEVCKDRFYSELDNKYLATYSNDLFTVDIPDEDPEAEADAEDIFSDFVWDIKDADRNPGIEVIE